MIIIKKLEQAVVDLKIALDIGSKDFFIDYIFHSKFKDSLKWEPDFDKARDILSSIKFACLFDASVPHIDDEDYGDDFEQLIKQSIISEFSDVKETRLYNKIFETRRYYGEIFERLAEMLPEYEDDSSYFKILKLKELADSNGLVPQKEKSSTNRPFTKKYQAIELISIFDKLGLNQSELHKMVIKFEQRNCDDCEYTNVIAADARYYWTLYLSVPDVNEIVVTD